MIRPAFDVLLASASPRRKELLAQLIPVFEVFDPQVEEDALTVPDPWQTARRLAWEKATSGFRRRSDAIVIGADTVVALPEEDGGFLQLAKPKDDADAVRMLERLADKRHAVITAVAIRSPSGDREFSDTAWVRFRPLSRQEIEAYVASGESHDKAGAYAIQGGAAEFVSGVEGLESTVIGLPYELLREELVGSGLATT